MTVLPQKKSDGWGQENMVELFLLEQGHASDFVARVHDSNLNGRVFGGQLLGQALAAAQHCCSGLEPATLHCLFLQGARTDQPLHYQVTPLQEGKRFTSLHVGGRQGERRVLDAQVTFQAPLTGFFHMQEAVDLPGPDEVEPIGAIEDGRWARFEKPFLQLRIIEPHLYLRECSPEPAIAYWIKLRERLPDAPAVHAAALAYLSDFWINSAAISFHVPVEQARERLFVSSLNHSLWFHRPPVADDWLLFVCESPSMQNGRGLTQVRIYDRSRHLVASIAQDCLISER